MFSLSQTTGYAIKALTCIAGGCEVKQIRDIAECTGITIPYLSKVIMRLSKSGILASKRGNKGGVWLARKPEEISLYQISEAVDGEGQLSACLLGLDSCSDERACPTHVFWKAARTQIRKQLEKTSLADVLAFEIKRHESGSPGSLLLPGYSKTAGSP
jgi:Rrf2 family protein